MVSIPSLIGGFPTQSDFAPSILLITSYVLSLFPFIKRLWDPSTKTHSLASTTACFAVERIVVYALRLAQSHRHRPDEDLGDGVLVYQQLSFAVGYIGLIVDTLSFARAVLVNTTLEDPSRGSADRPLLRRRMRRVMWAMSFALFWSTQLGMVIFGFLPSAKDSQGKARILGILRYVCDVVPLTICLVLMVGLLRVRSRLEFLDKPGLDAIVKLAATLAVIPLYRLTVLHFNSSTLSVIPSTTSPYPSNTLSTPSAKALFYIFHALPEIFFVYYVHCCNIRAKFNTGPNGDWQNDDVKDGIPRLTFDGVVVDGVGVPQPDPPKKKKGWCKRFGMFVLRLWRRRRHGGYDEESVMVLLPMKSTSSLKSDSDSSGSTIQVWRKWG